MDRPALKPLPAAIEAGKTDFVVVYKIDRLPRSPADFAKMVQLFDRHGVSFSALTQQINSPTSMGRLLFNVLLSLVQFEGEATGKRICDEIAASKRKGMWMAGGAHSGAGGGVGVRHPEGAPPGAGGMGPGAPHRDRAR